MRSGRIHGVAGFFLLYAVMYGAFGVASPFWPRFFETRGLTAPEIGLLLGLGMMVRLVSAPLIGRLADISGELRLVLAGCLALAAAFAAALLTAGAFAMLLVVHLLQSAALAPTTIIADALATGAATRNGFEYGRVRGTAAAAFIAGTLAIGFLLGAVAESIIWLHVALLGLAAGAAALLPRPQTLASGSTNMFASGIAELWAIAILRRVIVVSALVYGSHAVHDAFAVIRWTEAGIGATATSLLWSEAVAAEVLMFMVIGPALVRRLGANGAAALAAAAGIVRWCTMAATSSVAVLALVQPLHGFTFALLHLACMRLIASVVPMRLAATAQALYALGAGLVTVLLTLVSGQLYAAFAGGAFLPMALLCGIALPFAWYGLRQRTTVGKG